jgi:hypothetical protein
VHLLVFNVVVAMVCSRVDGYAGVGFGLYPSYIIVNRFVMVRLCYLYPCLLLVEDVPLA